MRYLLYAASFVFLAASVRPLGAAPEPTAFTLVASPLRQTTTNGKSVKVTLVLTMTSGKPLVFWVDNGYQQQAELDFEATIHDESGNVPSLTEHEALLEGKGPDDVVLVGSKRSKKMQKGSSLVATMSLTDSYILRPHHVYKARFQWRYRGAASFPKSNWITIRIT
jgi:hypothetical protein